MTTVRDLIKLLAAMDQDMVVVTCSSMWDMEKTITPEVVFVDSEEFPTQSSRDATCFTDRAIML